MASLVCLSACFINKLVIWVIPQSPTNQLFWQYLTPSSQVQGSCGTHTVSLAFCSGQLFSVSSSLIPGSVLLPLCFLLCYFTVSRACFSRSFFFFQIKWWTASFFLSCLSICSDSLWISAETPNGKHFFFCFCFLASSLIIPCPCIPNLRSRGFVFRFIVSKVSLSSLR